jgi:hypothetical protein
MLCMQCFKLLSLPLAEIGPFDRCYFCGTLGGVELRVLSPAAKGIADPQARVETGWTAGSRGLVPA